MGQGALQGHNLYHATEAAPLHLVLTCCNFFLFEPPPFIFVVVLSSVDFDVGVLN